MLYFFSFSEMETIEVVSHLISHSQEVAKSGIFIPELEFLTVSSQNLAPLDVILHFTLSHILLLHNHITELRGGSLPP